MRCERGLAFRSPLHARALPNLEGRALKAMRSVGLDSSTLRTSYLQATHRLINARRAAESEREPTDGEPTQRAQQVVGAGWRVDDLAQLDHVGGSEVLRQRHTQRVRHRDEAIC